MWIGAHSDACVIENKPLVSGAAIGTEGQLTVYNYGEKGRILSKPQMHSKFGNHLCECPKLVAVSKRQVF